MDINIRCRMETPLDPLLKNGGGVTFFGYGTAAISDWKAGLEFLVEGV